MKYQTREMTALQEIRHGSRLVAIGERFQASHIDANYYLTRAMAAEVEQPMVIERKHTEEQIASPAPRRCRPTSAARAAALNVLSTEPVLPKLDDASE